MTSPHSSIQARGRSQNYPSSVRACREARGRRRHDGGARMRWSRQGTRDRGVRGGQDMGASRRVTTHGLLCASAWTRKGTRARCCGSTATPRCVWARAHKDTRARCCRSTGTPRCVGAGTPGVVGAWALGRRGGVRGEEERVRGKERGRKKKKTPG